MKPVCVLIFILFAFTSFSQQTVKTFEADEFGRVKDSAFLKLIKERDYQLVEDFQPTGRFELKLAKIWNNGKQIYLDLNGVEFNTPRQASDFYKDAIQVESLRNQKKQDELEDIRVWIEEDLSENDPLWISFEDAEKLGENFVKVKLNGLFGIYTIKGNEVTPIIFKQIESYDKSSYFVCQRPKDNRYYIYNNLGKLTSDRGFYECTQFNSHLFRIQDTEGGNYGLWNPETNDTLLQVIYEQIELPYLGNSYPQITLKIETEKEKIVENQNFDDFAYEEKRYYGIIDFKGNILIEPKYEWIQYASKSGYFILKLNDKYGAVTKKNEPLLPFEYNKLSSMDLTVFNEFSLQKETRLPENLFIFQTEGTKTGVMNLDKKVLIEPIYDEMLATYNGVLVVQGDLTALLSIDGEIIVPFQRFTAKKVDNGKIFGIINDKKCLIDFYGNVMYR